MSIPARLDCVLEASGWAIHGLAFQFSDGSRRGDFRENDGTRIPLDDMDALCRRGLRVHKVAPGDYLVSVSGENLTFGVINSYLCYSLDLHFASGTTMSFLASGPADWRGTRFTWSHESSRPLLVEELIFNRGFQGVHGTETSVHLPITPENYDFLPDECKNVLELYRREHPNVPQDVLWSIFKFWTGYDVSGRFNVEGAT